MHSLRDQLSSEHEKLKETQQTTECRLRSGEAQKCELTERLEKCHAEIHTLRKDHMGLSEFLQRLANAMNWSECSAPPALGTDTNLMAENLLERAERLTAHCEHEVSHHPTCRLQFRKSNYVQFSRRSNPPGKPTPHWGTIISSCIVILCAVAT